MKPGPIGCIVSAISIVVTSPLLGVNALAEEPPVEFTTADPQLDQLDFFSREWQCESQMMTRSFESKSSMVKWSVNRDLNDLWFMAQGMTPEGDVFEREILGYNTIMGKFGRTIIGDDGKFANFLSAGWEDQTLIWEGRVSNMLTKTTVTHRIVITRTADHAFESMDYVSTQDQPDQWLLVGKKSCVCEQALGPS